MSRIPYSLAAALAALCFVPSLHAATYRVGSGFGCSHGSVQAALASAAANPGEDTIRITRSQSYVQQAIAISNHDVQLLGGFDHCLSPSAGAERTRLDGAGGARAPVLRIENANVRLQRLEIVNGDAEAGGGGIRISGSLHQHQVRLQDVRVAANSAAYGGGIQVSGSVLTIEADAVVENNDASNDGGGVHCHDAELALVGLRSRITGNTARLGGGLHATNCRVDIAADGGPAGGATLASNLARDAGGGAYLDHTELVMYPVDADSAPGFSNNHAQRAGGGLFVLDSKVLAYQSILRGNRADAGGGAAWVEARDVPTSFLLSGELLSVAEAVPCRDQLRCTLVQDNVAKDAQSVRQDGAAFMLVKHAGPVDVGVTLDIEDASLIGNQGRTLVRSSMSMAAPLAFRVDNSELRGNQATSSLIELPAPYRSAKAHVWLQSSTVAGNTYGGIALLHSQRALEVRRSILWQPGQRLLQLDGLPEPQAEYSLLSSLAGFALSPSSRIGLDPRFESAASLRLAADSPAIDFAPFWTVPLFMPDREGRERVDLATYPDVYGPADIGAFERQTERVICCALPSAP